MNEVNTNSLCGTQSKNTEISIQKKQKSFRLVEIPSIPGYCRKKTFHSNATKVIGLYFLLKAEAPGSGWIKNYRNQVPELSKNFGIPQRTFFNYLAQLKKLKIAFPEDDKIRLVGWNELNNQLKFNNPTRKEIKFISGKNDLNWWRNHV